jgi:hypothetical protein
MSFRSKVLDALDIHKKTIKLQCNETFPKVYVESGTVTAVTGEPTGAASDGTGGTGYTRANHVNYAVSKEIRSSDIGPNVGGGTTVKQKLDVLGFVVGDGIVESAYKNMYPITMPIQMSNASASSYSTFDEAYTGFHSLGGLYDTESTELKTMRKSAITPFESETMFGNGGDYGSNDHSHTDWPDNTMDQLKLLTENPYADSLYYHSTRLSFLLTGISIPDISEKASNHRGVVRMLIVRPRIPTVKTRWSGATSRPMINMAYPPHFDTDLFYTKTKTLGGRMDTAIVTRNAQSATNHNARKTHLTPSFGLEKYASIDPIINQQTTVQSGVANGQLHYGHPIPTDGTAHTLSSYDVLTAPINRDKYAVVVDKMVTLDTLHHGVASKRIENVVIPYNKKIKFPGRKPTEVDISDNTSHKLSNDVETEPVNFQSRPIIMFLSMDQKISAQVTGYTTITEC